MEVSREDAVKVNGNRDTFGGGNYYVALPKAKNVDWRPTETTPEDYYAL